MIATRLSSNLRVSFSGRTSVSNSDNPRSIRGARAGVYVAMYIVPSSKYDESNLAKLVTQVTNYWDLLALLNRPHTTGALSYLQRKLKQFGISTSHFTRSKGGRRTPALLASEVLVCNRLPWRESAKTLRKAMVSVGVPYHCKLCKKEPLHRGQPLRLQVDHIDGNVFDNRIENLRFLCPNCHSQTDNYAGRGRRYTKVCETCPTRISSDFAFCKKCLNPPKSRDNAPWPSPKHLEEMLREQPATEVAKLLGVSSSAVKKRCKKLGIPTPSRGYWTKVASSKLPPKPVRKCQVCARPITKRSTTGQCAPCLNRTEEKRKSSARRA